VRKLVLSAVITLAFFALTGCVKQDPTASQISASQDKTTGTSMQSTYEDGTYRGDFSDGGQIQVNIEFKLENNIVKSMKLKHLLYKGEDYIKSKDEKVLGVKAQYDQLAAYLVEKDIRTSLVDLYKPENIVKNKVDTLTGATLRSGKIISSIRDALNRGVYSYK
jgi:uncharacterized protein with FMN-binding domain